MTDKHSDLFGPTINTEEKTFYNSNNYGQKSFLRLTPGDNVTKLFSFVADDEAK
jgi:hypothetical protein